ncbi:MAG TPA: class I SAM-dependent methyltransferase [Ktedonobacterales bacterium]|nr:class I SAM-dependent methyltransferase [Ktedonobacterales bacterium]
MTPPSSYPSTHRHALRARVCPRATFPILFLLDDHSTRQNGRSSVESLRGKQARDLDAAALAGRLAGAAQILIDLGTGDGRFVRAVATACPTTFAIGIDACRDNLREQSRSAPPNALYLIANALALPPELDGIATHLTINFPWGSLLAALLAGDAAFAQRLAALVQPGARLEMRLNGGALAEAGWSLWDGGQRVRAVLRAAGFSVVAPVALGPPELRACPTTWAHRLAFGRDPRALELRGQRVGGAHYQVSSMLQSTDAGG